MGDLAERQKEMRGTVEYWQDMAVLEATEAICEQMHAQDITPIRLSRMLKKTRAYMTVYLKCEDGHAGIKQLAAIAFTLGYRLKITFVRIEENANAHR